LFELGWTKPSVADALGIIPQLTDEICHEYIVYEADEHDSFARIMDKCVEVINTRAQ
jgi:hypothetical protein